MNVAHPPASTIKTLLVLTVLDELPSLDATVVGTEADTHVECSCAGVKPGRTYTARQLLGRLLLMSGNDAANALADMIGGYDTAVAKMNAKAASLGAVATQAATPSGLDGAGGSRRHHSAGPGGHLPRRDGQSGVRRDHRAAGGDVPDDDGRQADRQRRRTAAPLSGTLGGKTGFTDAAKKTFVAAADRGGRRLVVAMMYGLIKEGGPTYWDQAVGLFDWGFAQDRQMSVGVAVTRRHQKLLIRNGSETSARLKPVLAQDTLSIRAKDVGCVGNRARVGELRGGRTDRDPLSPASSRRARSHSPDGPAQAWLLADLDSGRCWRRTIRTASTRPPARSSRCSRWSCSTTCGPITSRAPTSPTPRSNAPVWDWNRARPTPPASCWRRC